MEVVVVEVHVCDSKSIVPDDPEHVLGKLTDAAEVLAELAESAVSVRLVDVPATSERPLEGASPPLPDTSQLSAKLELGLAEASLEVSESASVTLITLGFKG